MGISTYTLYNWKRRFEDRGPEGLMDEAVNERKSSSRHQARIGIGDGLRRVVEADVDDRGRLSRRRGS